MSGIIVGCRHRSIGVEQLVAAYEECWHILVTKP